MKKIFLLLPLFFIISVSVSESSYGQSLIYQKSVPCEPTYGHYWRSDKRGWYGARRAVRTPLEAREILEKFFLQNKNITVGTVRSRTRFFEADIINVNGARVDHVIIDKRTGRIRSIY